MSCVGGYADTSSMRISAPEKLTPRCPNGHCDYLIRHHAANMADQGLAEHHVQWCSTNYSACPFLNSDFRAENN